jgi:hypothetical protein
MIMEKHTSPTEGWWFSLEADNTIMFLVVASGERYAKSTVNGSINWTHVVGTYDGTDVGIFVNGKNVTGTQQGTGSGNINYSGNSLAIGKARWGGMQVFAGTIDEVKIWNITLSEEQVYEQHASNLRK